MKIPVACNKTRGSGLTSSKCFSAIQYILVSETPHPPKSVADAAWISGKGTRIMLVTFFYGKIPIKDGMGQGAGSILQRMVGILQVGTESSQMCLPCAFWDPSSASWAEHGCFSWECGLLPLHKDFPHQVAFEASSQVVVNLGMSEKDSKDTWVMSVLEIPQSTSVPSVTYRLLVASWHQKKGTFLEHFFGAGGTDAVCPLALGRCPFCPGQRAFKGTAASSQAG